MHDGRAYAWSWGPLGWLYPTEIQTLETRSCGLAVASFCNLLFSAVIAQTFLTMLCSLQVWSECYVPCMHVFCVAMQKADQWVFTRVLMLQTCITLNGLQARDASISV